MTKTSDRLLDSQAPGEQDLSPLPREEYIEQAHFFEILLQRLRDNMPAQEVLASIVPIAPFSVQKKSYFFAQVRFNVCWFGGRMEKTLSA